MIAGPGSLKPVEGASFLVFPWLLVEDTSLVG